MSRQDGGSRLPENRTKPPARGADGVRRSLLRALRNTGVSVLYQDNSLRYVWGESIESPFWDAERLVGATDEDIMPTAEAERLRAAKESVLATGEPRRLEIQLPHSGGERFFDVWIDVDIGDDEAPGIVTTALEITEQKRREQTLRALLREVSHRSKNLLAIIQSIAMQTSRYSFSVDQFLVRFRGRIQSLASSQDLVTSSNWRGANLHQLIESQVGVYYTDPRRGVRVTGDDPYLTPNAALHVGLALHELAVNSVSYGALSLPGGHVDLAIEMVPDAEGSWSLRLVWSENIPSGTAKVQERRFGSIALERVVPTSLNGEASLEIGEERLEYRLMIPDENFETN